MELQKEKVQEIGNKSPTAAEALKLLSERERFRREINIPRFEGQMLATGKPVVPEHAAQFWKDLEAIGAGSIVNGRGNNPTRFVLHYSLKDIGRAFVAPNEVAAIPALKKKKEVKKQRGRGRPKGSKNNRKRSVNLKARTIPTGLEVFIRVTPDMSEREIASKVKQVAAQLKKVA